MQVLGGEHVTADQFKQRRQARRAGANPVCQGRHVELDALAGIAFALPVERLVLTCDPAWNIDPCRGVIGVQL